MRLLEPNDVWGQVGNYISVLLAMVEMFAYSGINFGFPFIEVIMKKELIFYEEVCSGKNNTLEIVLEDDNQRNSTSKILCEAALEQYNIAFTIGAMLIVRLILNQIKEKRKKGGSTTVPGREVKFFFVAED